VAENDTQQVIDTRLEEIYRSVLQNPTLQLRPDMRRIDVAGWDSTTHIKLVLEVEKQFNIRFSPSDIAKFSTVGELGKLIMVKRSTTT